MKTQDETRSQLTSICIEEMQRRMEPRNARIDLASIVHTGTLIKDLPNEVITVEDRAAFNRIIEALNARY